MYLTLLAKNGSSGGFNFSITVTQSCVGKHNVGLYCKFVFYCRIIYFI